MIRINEIKVELNEKPDFIQLISKKLKVPTKNVLGYSIFKESIDARKGSVKLVYTLDVELINEEKILAANRGLSKTPDMSYNYPQKGDTLLNGRPVIVGFGPAGIFCALILSQRGYKPLILEQGEDVDTRSKTVEEFWKSGKLNTLSNVQFGEGGAGTFSDGKLTTRIKDLRCRKVFAELVKYGAPEEILYKNKPHIGTDILKGVVKNIREEIINLGGEIRFSTKVDELILTDGKVKGVKLSDGSSITSDVVVLAIGHSSRDLFEDIHSKDISITPKPFAMGMRIEHPQSIIDKVQYKDPKMKDVLGAAEYHITYTTKKGRAVYTFCMCPGGVVVGASSEEETIVTNGMSYHSRDLDNSNSALLVSVTPEDYFKGHPLDGMYLQREIEKKAYEVSGKDYKAPFITVGKLLGEDKKAITIKPTYEPGVVEVHPSEYLPEFIVASIKEAIPELAKKLNGFDMPTAILTGPETRSSSPIRINRESETLQSSNTIGLYPCGEGAGYAGGIVSSAVDGIKVAEEIIKIYK